MNRNIYLFMGPPGAGKGTLSSLCVTDFGWTQLSTGSLCREHISKGTEIGKQIDFIIKSGKLISDSLIIAMVKDWFISHSSDRDVILDGFPRTLAQATVMHDLIKRNELGNYHNLTLVHLPVNDEILINRLAMRLVCENNKCQQIYVDNGSVAVNDLCQKCGDRIIRRSDDQEKTVKERLAVYREHATGLLDFFKNNGHRIIDVPAERPINEVFTYFKHVIGT